MKDLLDSHFLVLHETTEIKKINCYKGLKVELHSVDTITGKQKIIAMSQLYDRVLKETMEEDTKRLTDMAESEVLEQLLIFIKDNFKNVQL